MLNDFCYPDFFSGFYYPDSGGLGYLQNFGSYPDYDMYLKEKKHILKNCKTFPARPSSSFLDGLLFITLMPPERIFYLRDINVPKII